MTQTAVTASTSHSGASYEVQLGGVVDDDGVIPLAVGSNRIGVRVTAEDGVTTKIYTVIVTRAGPVSTVPLTAPTLTAKVTEGKVDLSWKATAGATRYELWTWWDSEVGWQQLDDGNLTATTYTHADVTKGTTYYYAIRAVNAGGGVSSWSEYETVTIPKPDPGLSAPALTAELAQGGVKLSWREVASAARYELWTWWDSEVGWQRLDGGSLTGTTYTHTDVTAGTTYFYAIRSVNAEGKASDWSEYVSTTVPEIEQE